MKKLSLALLLAVSSNVFAAGGFDCEVSLNSGTKFNVFACVPHSDIMGVCSNISIEKNGQKIAELPSSQVDGVWFDRGSLLLRVMDAEVSTTLIRLEYYGAKNAKNKLILNVPGAQKADKSAYTFRDVKCTLD